MATTKKTDEKKPLIHIKVSYDFTMCKRRNVGLSTVPQAASSEATCPECIAFQKTEEEKQRTAEEAKAARLVEKRKRHAVGENAVTTVLTRIADPLTPAVDLPHLASAIRILKRMAKE